jgi:glycine/D-amino acid oxidase-like deaminating enzyme
VSPQAEGRPETYDFDLVAIGSGPAGQRAAVQASKLGKRVAVIEKNRCIGGGCVETGTIPSKTFREAVWAVSSGPPTGARPTAEQLLGRVGDRRALFAVGDRTRDRVADDHRVFELAHTGITPCLRQGRSTRLSLAMRSPRMIVGRVSRGSMTSSMRSFLAAM